MLNYIFTDLACEKDSKSGSVIRIAKNILIKKSKISEGNGENIAFFTPRIWELSNWEFETLSQRIAIELRGMISRVCRNTECCSLLVAGLGNGDMTPDSLGPETVKKITVTRHIFSDKRLLLEKTNICEVSAIIPGVLANTGIETVELLKGVVSRVTPHAVLAVDSLAARNPERLAATVQLSDGGIAPGSGIGNHQKSINFETLGVPVIAIGIPTVIHSSTLVRDAVERLGQWKESIDTDVLLKEMNGFFVTPKETDLLIKSASILLADAIDRACTLGQE